MPLRPGTRLGPYEVVALLGAGGMGEVYRAHDPRLGRDIAVKVLPESVASDPEWRARFEREARTAAALNHPNIVTLHSIEEDEGRRFITMELLDGRNLAQIVTPDGLKLDHLLAIALPLAEALMAAHDKALVHRDLKPANIMVTTDGRLKVLDFGLAKLAHQGPDPQLTKAVTIPSPISEHGSVVGTAQYMSPEQLRGEATDARTDLFALGALLFELATGKRPFRGETRADLTSAILRDEAPPLSSLRPDLPRDLERIVARCLEKKPSERFQTARDVFHELRYVQRERERVKAAPAAAATPAPKPAPETQPPQPKHAASVAVLPFANRSRDEADEYFAEGLADELQSVLARIRGLRVAARTSSATFKGKEVTIEEAGRALHVESILEGSVRKAGSRVRITVQLVRVGDGLTLWSESYDRTLDDIFAVQDDIAQSVVRELRSTLLGETDSHAGSGVRAEVAAAAKGRTADSEAHRLFLQGRHLVDRLSSEDNRNAIDLLHRSLQLDPAQPGAWAWLSHALSIRAGYGWIPLEEGFARAREAADRALALAPDLVEGHAARGHIHTAYDWDWEAAAACFDRALELAPERVDVLIHASVNALARGRLEEAIEMTRRAVALDPLSSTAYYRLAFALRHAGRYEESDALLRKSLELMPQRVGAHTILAMNAVQTGRLKEALAEAEAEPETWARLLGRVLVHHTAGNDALARAALDELERDHAPESAYQIAISHAWLGDADAAFRWLDRAYTARDGGLALARTEPLLRGIHADPRWRAFLERMKQVD
jgi:serine/threonine protein kinase/Tfp pilus assembly protein PilF